MLVNMLTLLLSLTSSNTIHAEQERQKGKKRSDRWEVETGTILRDRWTAYLSLWGFLTIRKEESMFLFLTYPISHKSNVL